MKIEIPEQLQNINFRFNMLKKESKEPIKGIAWGSNLLKCDDEELINHIKDNKNYGVVASSGDLRIIDIDDKEIAEELFNTLDTFTVQTPGGGYHFYFTCDYNQNAVFKNKIGELRSQNYYVVGPTCYAIDTKKNHEGYYSIKKNISIKYINENKLFKIINKLLKDKIIEKGIQIDVDKKYIEENILNKIDNNIIYSLITTKKDSEELKNLGFESRSNRDQKIINYLVLNGFGNYTKSIFELYPVGDKYKEHTSKDSYLNHSIENARKYSGVVDDEIPNLEKEINSLPEKILRNKIDYYLNKISSFDSWSIQESLLSNIAYKIKINKKDLKDRLLKLSNINKIKSPIDIRKLITKNIPEIEYWLKPFISKNSLILIGGKPESFKSIFTLAMALSLECDNKFLEEFDVKDKPKILLYDLENGENVLASRLQYLQKGLNLDINKLTNFHIEYEFNTNNLEKELELANDYDIIILDSYRRFLEGNENDSEITNKFFNNFLNKLKNNGKTLIIIHHFRKGKMIDFDENELLDIFRGSSDIPAQFDIIYGMTKNNEVINIENNNISFNVNLIKIKNRLGLPIKDICTRITKDEANHKTIFNFLGYTRSMSVKEINKRKLLDIINNHRNIVRKELIDIVKRDIVVADITIDKYISELKAENKITQDHYGKYSVVEDN